ncbi:D-malate degradation protein R [Serratia quinivorans]|jgi:LysR family transcriptional activator of dmlA|nr:LysR substrate-binding domain-containing protein [Serratia quinivorans]CAI0694795.1 D-malate degradation protein R [Serratia quinivorans]CAI0705159.1 D-malate degradation protein R [Serratia quinivorans]CAI0809068.1 D-malate degradation protein R [Serratia quinivorans]CAI0825409.1 D-malate degradation protein R [Serratia quinivorans]CAI0842165.1 D-malate degradation protein R [Serratia quinivorans]
MSLLKSLPKQISLWHLNLFLLVAKWLSFNRAAQELGISPGYVTKCIHSLEKALDTKLFVRTTRQVMLSKSGEFFFIKVKEILGDVEDAILGINALQDVASGNLRISCNAYFGQHHLAPVLSLMERQSPGLNIWLDLTNQQNDLIADDIDIDIRIGSAKEPHLVAYKIASSFRVLCASPLYLKRQGTPQELDELNNHNCILYRPREESMGLWRLTDSRNASESKLKVKGSLSSSHSDVVKTWAVKNHGIALLPVWSVASELASGVLVRVLPQYQQSADIIAVIKNQEKKTQLIRTCVDFIKTHLQASLPQMNSYD